MMSSFPHALLLSALSIAQDNVSTAEAPEADPLAPLRTLRACQSILPPLSEADAPARPPLCDHAPAGSRCVPPRRSTNAPRRADTAPGTAGGSPAPEPPYTLMYTPGLTHVFSWLKTLNTCRFQAGSSAPRPTAPNPGDFPSTADFEAAQLAHEQRMEQRAQDVIAFQALTEPLLADAVFVAALPIDTLGEYDPEQGCFFPGPQARVNLAPFADRDKLYRTQGQIVETFRLIPQQAPVNIALGAPALNDSTTLQAVYFDEDTPEDDIVFQAHPLCVDATTAAQLRAQQTQNQIADFGIHFEGVFRFQLTEDTPTWQVSGEFVERSQPELVNLTTDPEEDPEWVPADRILAVQSSADREAPASSNTGAESLPSSTTGCGGCSTTARPGALLPLTALLGLLLWRRRPARHTDSAST